MPQEIMKLLKSTKT